MIDRRSFLKSLAALGVAFAVPVHQQLLAKTATPLHTGELLLGGPIVQFKPDGGEWRDLGSLVDFYSAQRRWDANFWESQREYSLSPETLPPQIYEDVECEFRVLDSVCTPGSTERTSMKWEFRGTLREDRIEPLPQPHAEPYGRIELV